MRISNSFSEGEIQVLEFILQTLLRGGTPSMATQARRRKEIAGEDFFLRRHRRSGRRRRRSSPQSRLTGLTGLGPSRKRGPLC
jgi:hypothetical protein